MSEASLMSDARRRVYQELGVDIALAAFRELGRFVYRADDEATGQVEHEYDHVLVAEVPTGLVLSPDPAEVASVRWVDMATLELEHKNELGNFAPWLTGVLEVAAPVLK